MPRLKLSFVIFASLLPACFAADPKGWAALKSGMTPAATVAALGSPLIRTAGHGFVLWIYDNSAEVLFYRGPVVAWTAPAVPGLGPEDALKHDVTVWPVFQVPRTAASAPVHPAAPTDAVEILPATHFRYPQQH